MDVMGVDCYNLCGTGSIGRTLATSSGGLNEHIPVVCYEVHADDVIAYDGYNMAVNDKTFMTITSGATDDHHVPSVCYCIEGHIVDRETSQNGCGWRKDSSHTLNATDRHAVCFPVESIGHDIRSTQFNRGGVLRHNDSFRL